MDYAVWIVAVIVGIACAGTGILGRVKTRGSIASSLYLAAMLAVMIATIASPVNPFYDESNSVLAATLIKLFVCGLLLADVLLCSVAFVFPVERTMRFGEVNVSTILLVVWFAVAAILGATAAVEFTGQHTFLLSTGMTRVLIVNATLMAIVATIITWRALPQATPEGRQGGIIYLTGLWVLYLSGTTFFTDFNTGIAFGPEVSPVRAILYAAGVGGVAALVGYAIISGRLVLSGPVPEKLVSSAKAKYKLLIRHAYLVEEPKPDFAFKMFTDVLKGRCNECENDDSFACESLDCASCGLPCPCHTCGKYKSRPQGLIVSRQSANDIRRKYYIQTTPILWLSTVQGQQNMDPAKLALLTDYITNFMETSPNGVVLVDGIEYLVTSNDFQRVQKAIDRWTECTMTSKCRLIMSIDENAFETKEVATMERDRETVRPNAKESWRIIPERI